MLWWCRAWHTATFSASIYLRSRMMSQFICWFLLLTLFGRVSSSCGSKKYGPHCEYNCQCIEDKTVRCESQTGHCLCKPGWQGIYCSEPCPFSYCGENCSKYCSCHNNGNCNHITGQCECQIGFKGDRSGERCDEGTFGLNCQGKCNCQTGSSCELYSGKCIYTTGNSHQLESDKITDHPVIIGLLSAILSVIILYIFIKNKNVIVKNWQKCCKMQETREHVPPRSIQVEDGNGSKTQQAADSTPVKQTGRTDPVLPRKPGASMNISEETDHLLTEEQASGSACNKSETELNFMPTARGRGIRLASINIRDNITVV